MTKTIHRENTHRVAMHLSLKRIISSLIESSTVYDRSDFKKCGDNVSIYRYPQIWSPENVELEDDVSINDSIFLDGIGGVVIKKGAMIGPNVCIYSCSHNFDAPDQTIFPFDGSCSLGKVVIGEFSWVGRNAIILAGVTIGKGCVIGAGSVVTKDIEDFSIVAGNPAKLIRKRNNQNINDSTLTWMKGVKEDTQYGFTPNTIRKFVLK